MEMYFIRHGENLGNSKRCYSGWLQHELTDAGRNDAENAGKLLRKIRFDKKYTPATLYTQLKRQKLLCRMNVPNKPNCCVI